MHTKGRFHGSYVDLLACAEVRLAYSLTSTQGRFGEHKCKKPGVPPACPSLVGRGVLSLQVSPKRAWGLCGSRGSVPWWARLAHVVSAPGCVVSRYAPDHPRELGL